MLKLPPQENCSSSSDGKDTAKISNCKEVDFNSLNFKIGTAVNEERKLKFITPLEILNLCANLSNQKSSIRVQIILNKFLQQITKAEHIVIIPILLRNEEGLIQVISDKVLNQELRFTVTADDVRNASKCGYHFNISDLNRDFREFIHSLIGIEYNLLLFDINELNKNMRSNLPALVPKIDKEISNNRKILKNCSVILNDDLTTEPINNDGHLQLTFFICITGDESLRCYYRYCIYETLRFTMGHLLTAIELEEERRFRSLCEKLLKRSRNLLGRIDCQLMENREVPGFRKLFVKIDIVNSLYFANKYVYQTRDITPVLSGILEQARLFVGAESCSLFLRDRHTGELITRILKPDEAPHNNIRIYKSRGIAGLVGESGKLVNIRDVYKYPWFDPEIDEQISYANVKNEMGYKNMLCFPIFDKTVVIGVVQLRNKLNGYHFDKCDEEIASAFQIYVGLVIMQSIIDKSVQKAEARHKLSHEIMVYHMKIPEDDIKQLIEMLENIKLKKTKIPKLNSFTFMTRDIEHIKTLEASLQMFYELNFITKFNISSDKLAKFLIIVQKGYRDLPYHNWRHAFTTAHFAYCIIINCKLIEKGILSDLEAIAFIIATLCHDIDHRGTANYYQILSKSNISNLYTCEGSVNERHHLAQTFHILKDEERTNILENLSPENYQYVLDRIQDFIVASDLAYHFQVVKYLKTLTADNCLQNDNKKFLLSLIMTCSDLCDQVKKWSHTKKASDLIYREFFYQGDLEKRLGLDPQPWMDRKKAIIPLLQVQFLRDVAVPAFQNLANALPETAHLLNNINKNLEHWQSRVPEWV